MKNMLQMCMLTLAATLISATCFGQWSVSTTGTGQDLNSVYMVSGDIVIATGNNGSILRSTDGGATYTQVFTAVDDVSEVQFVNANRGYAVADNGRFLTTTNAGLTWSMTLVGTGSNLTGLHFRDANNGHIVGRDGVIFITSNGGANWTSQTSGTTERLESVHFTNANMGYIAGRNDTYLTTTNGGASWSVSSILGNGRDLNDITFTSATMGYIASDNGVVLRSTDGGASWNTTIAGTVQNLNEVHFVDAATGYLAGDGGVIRMTTDGGVTWVAEASGTLANLEDIHATTANNGVAAGNGGSAVYKAIAPCTTPVTGLNVNISVATNSVNFTWDAYPDAQSYLVEGGALGGGIGSVSTLTNSMSLAGNSNFNYATTYIWRVTATCTDGSVAPASAFETFTTPSARLAEENFSVTVGPNPATQFIQVSLTSASATSYQIRLLDISGQEVIYRNAMSGTELLDVSMLSSGIYFLEVLNDVDRIVSKISIK